MPDEGLEMQEKFKMNKNVNMWVNGGEDCYT